MKRLKTSDKANYAIKAWNLAPLNIKSCSSVWSAKNEIKKICQKITYIKFHALIHTNHVHSLVRASYNHYKSMHLLKILENKLTYLLTYSIILCDIQLYFSPKC